MKKKTVNLDRKLVLQKAIIAELNAEQQNSVLGGITARICPTQITVCIETSPAPNKPCVACP
ncbi:MAG TPA: class I lanthipeptide [Chitinophaga sp.]|uniref:class I lanthipeptide n=1 Tax=Chitinophaga sp. TaxID=1869181 RepID=UPI002C386EA8|nr:class I lanthipeptide [Chitinophaga sp.]HVI48852.1 class I lanthipeptide [Chitinophaga sp.]